jgi:proteasome lid subunit RPN8/RPN11
MRALIDHGILSGYRARAIKKFPIEYCEFLWGTVEKNDFIINVIERADVDDADEESVEVDSLGHEFGDEVDGQILLGTIHSHPEDVCEPSDSDIESASTPPEAPEQVFGIMALNRSANRWLTSYGFFLPNGTPVELVVSKPVRRKKAKAEDARDEQRAGGEQ